MFRTARTELAALRKEAATLRSEAEQHAGSRIRAEDDNEQLRRQLTEAITAAARAEGQLEAMRAQHLLDTEDRACLRMLLRTARKQARDDRVYVLFRHGALHSVHATHEAAEEAAEAEGAPRGGWTAYAPGAALPPAVETPWRVQPLPLGGPR